MRNAQRARTMRAGGMRPAAIARTLCVHQSTIYRQTNDVTASPDGDATTIVRRHAHNGGCSTLSGMMPIRMPRIVALHGEVAA